MSTVPETAIVLAPIGWVRSPLTSVAGAPLQADESAPEAWLEIDPAFATVIAGLEEGTEVFVLTWLHAARRDTLTTPSRPTRATTPSVPRSAYLPPGLRPARIRSDSTGPRSSASTAFASASRHSK